MTQLILRVINVIEVLSIYYAIKHQRQGDRNATEQQRTSSGYMSTSTTSAATSRTITTYHH
jgi:hypothetical protein